MGSIIARAVQDEDAVLASSIGWPLTAFGSVILFVKTCVLLMALVLGAVLCNASDSCSGAAWDESVWGTRAENPNSCEKYSPDKFMQERANTLSNAFFIAAGFVVAGCGTADALRKRTLFPLHCKTQIDPFSEEATAGLGVPKTWRANNMNDFPVLSLLLGYAIVAQGICSFMFHAHATELTKDLDLGLLNIILSLLTAGAAMLCVDPNSPRLALYRGIVLGVAIVFGAVLAAVQDGSNAQFIGVALIFVSMMCVLLCVFRRGVVWKHPVWRVMFCVPRHMNTHVEFQRMSLVYAGTFLFGTAFVFRFMDDSKSGCDPESLLQFHAVWHALGSLALLAFYFFMRSERTVPAHMAHMAGTVNANDLVGHL